jgi:hypothetical protein
MRHPAASVLRLIQPAVGSWVCLFAVTALAADLPGKADLATPPGPLIASNLNRLDANGFISGQGRDGLFNSSETAPPRNSLDPVVGPFNFTPPRTAPDARTKQRQEDNKNWMFKMWTDDLDKKDINLESAYGLDPDGMTGKDKQHVDPIEKFYEGQGKKPASPARQGFSESDPKSWKPDYSGTNAFYPQGYSFFGAADSTGGVANADAKTEPGTGFNRPDFPAKKDERALQREAEWRKLLDGPSATAFGGGAAGNFPPGAAGNLAPANANGGGTDWPGTLGMTPATLGGGPAGGQAMAPAVYHNPANSLIGSSALTPAFRPSVLDDPTARALGLPQPALNPQPAPPRKAATAYQFETPLPKRNF